MTRKQYQRTLRSRELRFMLWRKYQGRCAICGEPIALDRFHADHIRPFSITQRTNVYEMQPLCPACNLTKGARV